MILLAFSLFAVFASGARKDKCKKSCERLFFGNSSLINKCSKKCKSVGKSKESDKEIFKILQSDCAEYCKKQYRYSPEGKEKCVKKCESIHDI